MARTDSATPSYARRIRLLGLFVVVMIGVYTAGWFYVANLIETRTEAALQQMRARGVEVDCERPEARGYPFRIGLFCDSVAFADPRQAVSASAGAFRSAGQIYDPLHLVAELDGPATANLPQIGGLVANWSQLHASVRLAEPLPSRVSVEGAGLTANREGGDRLVSAETFEGHMRPNERDIDLAFRFGGLAIDPALAEGRSIPALSGEGDVTVADGVRLVVDKARDLRGRSATIHNLSLSLGGSGAVSLKGTVAVDDAGLVDADLTLGLTDPKALSASLVAAAPEASGQIQQIFAGLAMLGDNPSLPLRVVKGKASIGFIPLGQIAPLPARP